LNIEIVLTARPPSLSSIAAFEAASRHQSFARAAAELNLSQGAVSHAIRALEGRLGRRLFTRAGPRVTLTDDGVLLANRVRTGLSLIEEAFDTGDGTAAPLRVSVLPAFVDRVLAPHLGSLARRFPEVSFDIRSSSQLANIADDEVDLGIRFGPGDWAGLQCLKLGDDTIFPVASPAFVAAHPNAEFEDLLTEHLIEHPGSSLRLWLSAAGLHELRPRSRLAFDDAGMALRAAAAGNGVVMARGILAAGDLANGSLVRLSPHEATAEYAYWCAWRATARRAALIGEVAAWLALTVARMSRREGE
jgi:LysR family glycine cleavage system transcriptional activator